MSVRLVAQFAQVRLVGCVHVHVLFPIAAVGEASVTAVKLAQKRLLAWITNDNKNGFNLVS